ncbi:MAG TPA: hypothetical protein VGB00_07205 [Pyrinomonadaceae bacterium]
MSWGARYAPSNPVLLLTNMNSVIAAAEAVADALQAARAPYRNATAAAADAFEPLSNLTTRVLNALEASGVPASVVEDAKTYVRKIKGTRRKPAAADDPTTPDIDESQASYSASQMSRTQRVENFDALVLLLETQTLYNPNEADLKIDALQDLSTALKAKHQAVNTAFVAYSNQLGERDRIYYSDGTGIVSIGNLFKKYALAAFGKNSAEHNQVKDLEFKKIPR